MTMNIFNRASKGIAGLLFVGAFFVFGLATPAAAQYEFYFNVEEFVNEIVGGGGGGYVDPGVVGEEAAAAVANAAAAAAGGEGSTVMGMTAEEWLAIAAAEAGQQLCMQQEYGSGYCETIAAPVVTRDAEGRITQIVCGNGTVFNFTYAGGGTPPPSGGGGGSPTCGDYNLSGAYPDCYDPNPPVNPTCAEYNMSGSYPDCYADGVVVAVPTCEDSGLSGEYPFCFDPTPSANPTCAESGLSGEYPACFVTPPPAANTLKVCQNSCSSGVRRGDFTVSLGGSQNLVACFNSSAGCDDASGNVTSATLWADTNSPQNAITLAASVDPKVVVGTGNGWENLQATYSGQTQSMQVSVTCVPTVSCATAPGKDGYCQNQSFSVDNGCGVSISCAGSKTCDFNWKEVAP